MGRQAGHVGGGGLTPVASELTCYQDLLHIQLYIKGGRSFSMLKRIENSDREMEISTNSDDPDFGSSC